MSMKRIVVLVLLASLIGIAEAKKKKEEKPNPDPKSWVTKLKWSKYEKTDIASVNDFYAQGDTIYKHLNDLASNMTFYDVRKIVNTETGDTLVAVVDDQGNIRGSKAAAYQYLQAGLIALTIADDIKGTYEIGKTLRKDWKKLLKTDDAIDSIGSSKRNPLAWVSVLGGVAEDLSLGKKLGKAVDEMLEMSLVVARDLKDGFANQRKKIKTYNNYTKQPEATPFDPPLRSLPDLPLNDDVLSKSDQEILDGLANAQKEDEAFVSEHGSIFDEQDSD